jgi:nicotinate-nucleotide adenylyltransferase
MQKTVALFGGSFNPPHEGHFAMASYIHQTLKVDETWMLFSQNPDKDPAAYPSLEHRMNMAKIMARHYDVSLVLSDQEAEIAKEIGRNDTYYILEGLQKRFPENKFIFVMGADTFAGFHLWKEQDDILNEYIVAVVDRPGYTEKALTSSTAIEFAETKINITQPENLRQAQSGWCFLNNPQVDVSSSGIVRQFAEGRTEFDGHFNEIAEYVYEHGLYGTNKAVNSGHNALSFHAGA